MNGMSMRMSQCFRRFFLKKQQIEFVVKSEKKWLTKIVMQL